MTRNGIVCVEWSGPGDPLEFSDRYWHSDRRTPSGPVCAYVVERDGEPLYVGSTRKGLCYRMCKHERATASPLSSAFREARAGGRQLAVRWLEVSACAALRFEGQLHRSIQAPLNSIDRFWRNIPLRPDRTAASHRRSA